jgi:uncharacterized protein YoaH (UPF0181 family)
MHTNPQRPDEGLTHRQFHKAVNRITSLRASLF